ncbi:MAG TPA: hypothetical protein VH682_08935, partial [Gemmataceae bacterium]
MRQWLTYADGRSHRLALMALVLLLGGARADLRAEPATSVSASRSRAPSGTETGVPLGARDQPPAPAEGDQGSETQLPPPRHVDNGPPPVPPPPPLRLADAIRRSLANVQTVQANVAVQTATIGRFEALKQFLPLVTLPQLMTGFRNFDTTPGSLIIFPDVTGGTPFVGQPGDHAALNRVFYSLPLDPSGHITALPIAEEGIRAKVLMEQLVRRSQAIQAIQEYFEAKQIPYGIR